MARLDLKRELTTARLRRVRNVIRGTSERPRLMVKISNYTYSAQIIDDSQGKTIVGLRDKPKAINIETATAFGKKLAEVAKKAKVKQVVLDRGSKQYHGRLKAIADEARKNGLEF